MRDTLAVIAFVVLLRVPFLNQAIQGDDVNYLAAAQHAQIDPLHPTHARFLFQGDIVTMQGHPHPPLNAWFLAALLALAGDVREPVYHAAYIPFSILAALSVLSLARRFTSRPLLATFLFTATPAFVVNGTSLESDLPFLALWLAVTACFVKAADQGSRKWLAAAAALMPLAAISAFQSIVLVPVLAAFLWRQRRQWKPGWLALAVIPAVLGGWQLFEKMTAGQLPAQFLAGYFTTYALQTLANKLRNAAALVGHLGWLVFPVLALFPFPMAALAALPLVFWIDVHPLYAVSLLAGAAVLIRSIQMRRDCFAAWTLIYFAAALVLFFAGSARYLLPIAAPVAILTVNVWRRRPGWLWAGMAIQLLLSLALAAANYGHWDGYRRVVCTHEREWDLKRVWINGEWGLRYYAETAGAMPLMRGQAVRPGDIVISSRLALPIRFTTGGGALVPVSETPIRPAIPLRLIGLGTHSAYSTASQGFRPFDIHTGPADIVRIETVVARKPALSFLPMNAPEADEQIVSGIDRVEENRYRWMRWNSIFLIPRPRAPSL
ncbi:MAG: glycosyltransferase family 39 protein [Acidobacteria bacterium]|nr:glycosyltransferase family 39 protein [Acidobacteriota bacterium]